VLLNRLSECVERRAGGEDGAPGDNRADGERERDREAADEAEDGTRRGQVRWPGGSVKAEALAIA